MPDAQMMEPTAGDATTPGGLPLKYAQPGVQPSVEFAKPAPAAPAPAPKRFRVDGLPPGGRQYVDQQGRTSRLVPGKVLDERYFPIAFIKRQGFALVEVDEDEPQIGRTM